MAGNSNRPLQRIHNLGTTNSLKIDSLLNMVTNVRDTVGNVKTSVDRINLSQILTSITQLSNQLSGSFTAKADSLGVTFTGLFNEAKQHREEQTNQISDNFTARADNLAAAFVDVLVEAKQHNEGETLRLLLSQRELQQLAYKVLSRQVLVLNGNLIVNGETVQHSLLSELPLLNVAGMYHAKLNIPVGAVAFRITVLNHTGAFNLDSHISTGSGSAVEPSIDPTHQTFRYYPDRENNHSTSIIHISALAGTDPSLLAFLFLSRLAQVIDVTSYITFYTYRS